MRRAQLVVPDPESATLRIEVDESRWNAQLDDAHTKRKKTENDDFWVREHGRNVQQLRSISVEEFAKRDVLIDMGRTLRENIIPWMERELSKRNIRAPGITIEFDSGMTFRLCPHCQEISDEDACWGCKTELLDVH